jgi:hypothetical protein
MVKSKDKSNGVNKEGFWDAGKLRNAKVSTAGNNPATTSIGQF